MNGASDLMVAVFGDKGRHARTTIGVAALPLDAAVEVEACSKWPDDGVTCRLDWLTARPIAHRGLHDAAAGVIENTPSAFARRHRRRLRHRMRSADQRRRRGHGAS